MTAEEFVPSSGDLRALAKAAAHCQGCELYRDATQTVFGRGNQDARFVLIGEQPGDQEDRRGEPFVGPAGALLDRALAEAGIDPGETYVTNAVKHFRWKSADRGKRRIHEKPGTTHINACRPWLFAELSRLRPDIIVLLGATAGQALFGPKFRVSASRGVPIDWQPDDGPKTRAVATVHPSAVLRAPDRDAAYAGLLADLRACAELTK